MWAKSSIHPAAGEENETCQALHRYANLMDLRQSFLLRRLRHGATASRFKVRPCQPTPAGKHSAHPGMNNEILWLIRLGLDQKLFNRDQALTILRMLGRDVALMDFAQKLIDDGIVSDVDKLEAIAGDAMARAAGGAP
jgi:hypothetical protein